MKKIIFVVLVMLFLCSNITAVYHKIAHFPTDNNPVGGELTGNNLVLVEEDKFSILNITNPSNPEIISQTNLNFLAQEILIQDSIAFIGGAGNICIYNLSDLENPQQLSTVSIYDYCVSLSINDNMLYASCCQDGIYLINISDLQNPSIEAHFEDFLCTTLIEVKWPILFVQLFDSGLAKLLNVENPNNIEVVGEIASLYEEFIINDDVLYINSEPNHINLFDISNPSEPIQLSSCEGVGCPLTLEGNILYTRENGIDAYQINENYELSFLGIYDIWEIVEGFEVLDGIAYEITRWKGLQILDFNDPIEERCVGSSELPIFPVDMNLFENSIYLNYEYNEMAGILDISDYENPVYQQFPNQDDQFDSFTLWNDVLFAKDWFNIYTFDLSNPVEPILLETFEGVSGSNKLITMDDMLIEFDYSIIKTYSIDNSIQITEIDSYNDIGYKTAFEANNGFIYYAIYQEGIKIIDIQNPSNIIHFPIDVFIGGLRIKDNILYVSSENEIILLDIADPYSVELITSIQPHEDSEFIAPVIIEGNDLIIADASWNEISIYDISNSTMPTLTHSYRGNREIRKMLLMEDYLLTGNNRSGFAVITLDGFLNSNENEIVPNFSKVNNYPNPFNPTTTIEFSIRNDSKVDLSIYNIKGQNIKTLLNCNLEKGNHSIIWDGSDNFGKSVSSGVYFYKLKTKDNQSANRMLLLK